MSRINKVHSYFLELGAENILIGTETICTIAEIREFDWIMMAVMCVGQTAVHFRV